MGRVVINPWLSRLGRIYFGWIGPPARCLFRRRSMGRPVRTWIVRPVLRALAQACASFLVLVATFPSVSYHSSHAVNWSSFVTPSFRLELQACRLRLDLVVLPSTLRAHIHLHMAQHDIDQRCAISEHRLPLPS